jgi:hypothetical protein
MKAWKWVGEGWRCGSGLVEMVDGCTCPMSRRVICARKMADQPSAGGVSLDSPAPPKVPFTDISPSGSSNGKS